MRQILRNGISKTIFLVTMKLPILIGGGFFLVTLPIILLLSIPIVFLRSLISVTSKWMRGDLGDMVSCRGTVFTTDPVHTKPRCNIVVRLTLEGKLDLDNLRDLAIRTLVNPRFPNGQLKYPELKQYLYQWMGFFFWKDDLKFDIKNHVNSHIVEDDEVISDVEINKLQLHLVQKPWVKGRALWGLILVPNCKLERSPGPKSILFLRIHHVLADGLSILSLLGQGLSEMVNPLYANPVYHERDVLRTLLFSIAFPFQVAYEFSEFTLSPYLPWINTPFSIDKEKHSGQLIWKLAESIDMKRIKEISTAFGVNVTAVLTAAVAGGLRDIMILKNIRVPKELQFNTTMPLPGHPAELRNYFAAGAMNLPVGEVDPVKRLRHCGEDNKRLKASAYLTFSKFVLPFTGLLFPRLTELTAKFLVFHPVLTMVSCGKEYLLINGHKCLDLSCATDTLFPGNTGFIICGTGYVDGFRFSISADACFMNKKDATEMSKRFGKEINILYKEINVQAVVPK